MSRSGILSARPAILSARPAASGRTARRNAPGDPPPPPPAATAYQAVILARSGLLGAWLFDGADLTDITAAGNDGSWTSGSPTTATAPIIADGTEATTLAVGDVGTIPHLAAYDRGDGPFAVEFWTNALALASHDLVTLSDSATVGWRVRASGSLLRLADPTAIANIRSADVATDEWHHCVVTRGTAANGYVYVDGIDVTTASNPITFASVTASDLLVTVDGSIYGLALYDRELTLAEALTSASYAAPVQPPVDPPADPPPVTVAVEGYGKNVTGGTTPFEVTTSNLTGAGSLTDALSVNGRLITFASGITTIAFGATSIFYVNGKSDFTIDGGGVVNFTGGPMWLRSTGVGQPGCSNFIIRNLRHIGGYTGNIENGDNFTIVDCHDFVFQNVSATGCTDEGISVSARYDSSYQYTMQDCLIGGGASACHRYGSLNSSDLGSIIRTAFLGVQYRAPQHGGGGLLDVVNGVSTGYHETGCIGDAGQPADDSWAFGHIAGKVNLTNCYAQDFDHASDPSDPVTFYHTGISLVRCGGTMPTSDAWNTVDTYARVASPRTALAAKEYVKTYAGCRPRNATETALLALLD